MIERLAIFLAGVGISGFVAMCVHPRQSWPLSKAAAHKGNITIVIGYNPDAKYGSQKLFSGGSPSEERWDDEAVITYRDFDDAVEARNRALAAAWRLSK